MKTTITSALLLAVGAISQAAMQPMDEAEMSAAHGAGIAVALDDFAYLMAPTSYLEQVGSTPADACTGSGTVASNLDCWRRGDLRWYGLNLSSAVNVAGAGLHWDDTSACNPGATAMNCPRGGQIANFSPFDNPYLMRAWSPKGMDYQGNLVNNDPGNPDKTIYEYLAPTSQPDYLMSFWGEIEAGATRDPSTQALAAGTGVANDGGLLKSQTIIRGNAAGSVFRMFRFTDSGTSPLYGETFAMLYHSYLQGDFRFSVAQHDNDNNPGTPSSFASDTIGQAPRFGNNEGLHFRNVDAFLPLGQLYYQALVLNAVGNSGNFSLELTRIPNNPTVYNRYYGLNDGDVLGYETARLALANLGQPCAADDQNCLNYRSSHGHIRYGDWHPGAATGRNSINNTNDGIFFRACIDCAPFNAYAARSLVIDKRGPTNSRQRTQNYQCNTGNAGGCTVDGSGPVITQSIGDYTRTFPTKNVNLGDARMEGLLINRFELISCQSGGC
ncbi:hypothetical protein [Alcanivorax jadensis]|uniref:hypothetical protein n=1 Tax=Alcanivorax jadensis TaxID=64988 RepID=UPI0026EC9B69|nr:hypothetical protein [Alcanivorax jadensis]